VGAEAILDLNKQQAQDDVDLLQMDDAHQEDLIQAEIIGEKSQIISPGTCLLTYCI
jgi:hypothetical protein